MDIQPAEATGDSLSKTVNWSTIDADLRSIIAPTSCDLASDISTQEAGDTYGIRLRAHLENHGIIKSPAHVKNDALVKRSRRIERVTDSLRLQNRSRGPLKSNRKIYRNNMVRDHNISMKACKALSGKRELRK